MIDVDIFGIIPRRLRQKILDELVEFLANQAKRVAGSQVSSTIRKLRSDATFRDGFEDGLDRAIWSFVRQYEHVDEDLVAAIVADRDLFEHEEIQDALIAMLKQPGTHLADQHDVVAQSFASVLPHRKNRERVDRAVGVLLRCLARELWHLPELQPIYSLQFQQSTAEAMRQQVQLQKAQLQALNSLSAEMRAALLKLTDAMAEQRMRAGGKGGSLPAPLAPSPVRHNLPQPDYGRFVGRDREIAQVSSVLRPYPHSQHALVSVDGIGGIGKTALALEVALSFVREYDRISPGERFHAIVWTSAKQTVLTADGIARRPYALRTLHDIFTAIAVTLGRDNIMRAPLDEQDELIRGALNGQRTLLIVDNLETIDDEMVMTFLRELPAPTKAIITTRHRIDVAYPVRLAGMPWSDALELIASECKKKGVRMDRDDTRRLYNRTGGVPLALVWSIAQIAFGHRQEDVLRRLGKPSADVSRFCFEGAVNLIRGTPAHELLIALSLSDNGATRDDLGNVTGLNNDVLDRDDALVQLEKLSLVYKRGDQFNLLPLVKSFVVGDLRRDPTRETPILERWVDLKKRRGLFIDVSSGRVWVAGREVELTPMEFKLLLYLYQRAENVCERPDIIRDVFHHAGASADVEQALVNSTVSRLRRKVEPDPDHPRYIVTAHGRGYVLVRQP